MEEFLDPDRYETIIHRSSQIIVLKMIFDNPWDISVDYEDILQILLCK